MSVAVSVSVSVARRGRACVCASMCMCVSVFVPACIPQRASPMHARNQTLSVASDMMGNAASKIRNGHFA